MQRKENDAPKASQAELLKRAETAEADARAMRVCSLLVECGVELVGAPGRTHECAWAGVMLGVKICVMSSRCAQEQIAVLHNDATEDVDGVGPGTIDDDDEVRGVIEDKLVIHVVHACHYYVLSRSRKVFRAMAQLR